MHTCAHTPTTDQPKNSPHVDFQLNSTLRFVLEATD